jgi:hypothetical protein
MGLVYDEEPKYRAHCVMAGPSKVVLDDHEHSKLEGICTVWTRKYPLGWEGISMTEAGDLVNYPSPISAMPNKTANNDIEWAYSTAICVDVGGVETRIECPVLKKTIEFEGVTYDLEPGWDDVVNALKKEFSAWAQRECSVQQQLLVQSCSPPKNSPRESSKQNPKKPKKDQHSMHSPQSSSPLQKAVAQAPGERLASLVNAPCRKKGDGMRDCTDQETSTTVSQGMGPRLKSSLTPQVNQHHGGILQPHHPHNKATCVHSFASPSPGGDALHHPHAHFSNETSTAAEMQQPAAPPLVQEKAKSKKRSRQPSEKKPVALKEEVQESSGQGSQAADAATPPSTGKSGSKRKRSAGTHTPAKKRAAAKKSPASQVQEDGSETLEATQDSIHKHHVQFGSEIDLAPLGEFETPQMKFPDPFQADGLPRSAAEISFSTWSNHSGHMANQSCPSRFEHPGPDPYIQNAQSPMSGMNMGMASSTQFSISQQLRWLDQHQAALIASFRNDHGISESQRVNHKLAELNAYRTRLLAMSCGNPMSANRFGMSQPYNGYFQPPQDPRVPPIQWNNSSQQLNDHQMSGTQQNIDQQRNYLPISTMESNNGTQQTLFQMAGIQENDDSFLGHSQISERLSNNQSAQASVPRPHHHQSSDSHQSPTTVSSNESWATPEVGSLDQLGIFQGEARSTTPCSATYSMSNLGVPFSDAPRRGAYNQNNSRISSISQPESRFPSTTPQPSIAEYPHNSVENARGYVTSLLQTPMDQLLQTPWEEHQRIMRQRHEEMQKQKSTEQREESEENGEPEPGES